MESSDLQAKYQKLASEYSKLRSQLPVLKKAVLDEQATVSQLRDALKERDQSLRKSEQENDSLSFRNKQLTSRVEVLQRELDGSGVKSKKNKGKSSPDGGGTAADGIGVIGQELQNKIEENARLHKQVNEADEAHRELVEGLQKRLTVLEAENSQHESVLSATLNQNKSLIERLTEEKTMLEVKIQQQEKELHTLQSRAQSAEESLHSLQTNLTGRLSAASQLIQDKVPFNDTSSSGLNALNVPIPDRQHQLKAKDLFAQAGLLIKQLVQSLSNLHTYTEQRTAIYPLDAEQEPLSAINAKFCGLLHENASYLRPVDQAYKHFCENIQEDGLTTLETATGLQGFAEKLKNYVAYLTKLLPYHLLSIEEECSVSTCTPTLESKNWQLHCALQRFTATFSKLQGYVSLIAHQSEDRCDHPRSSHAKLFELLAVATQDFHEAVKELSKHFNAKICLEHQLPTASSKLKTTDECLMASLIALVTCTNKLSVFLSSNLDFLSQSVDYKSRSHSVLSPKSQRGARAHPLVASFRHQAAQYIASIAEPCADSVPYQVAIHNRRTLLSSTESRESLAQQVVGFQERVSELEQEREHWRLEAQLNQMKYQRMQQATDGCSVSSTQSSSSGDSLGLPVGPSRNVRANTKSNLPSDVSMLGEVEAGSLAPETEATARETLIKNYLTQRISALNLKLQNTDSRALHFHAECRALHKRLSLAHKSKDNLSSEVSGAGHTITSLKDELQMTSRSYESQLSMMSEHLASMNEKLALQKEEIEALKHQIATEAKSGKRNRHK